MWKWKTHLLLDLTFVVLMQVINIVSSARRMLKSAAMKIFFEGKGGRVGQKTQKN